MGAVGLSRIEEYKYDYESHRDNREGAKRSEVNSNIKVMQNNINSYNNNNNNGYGVSNPIQY